MQINKAKIRYVEEDAKQKSKKKNVRVSTYTEDFKGEFYNLKVEKLIPFKNQARLYFDDESLNSLAQTIKEHGIRQPLTVIPSEEKQGFYEIVSGERRFRAAKILGLKTVPCIIIHDKKKAEEIAIIENIQRKDLHPVELMKAYDNLINHEICKSISDIARRLGVARTSVIDVLNLKNLDNDLQKYLVENNIKNRDFLRELIKTAPDYRFKKAKEYLDKKMLIQPHKAKTKTLRTKAKVLEVILEADKLQVQKNQVDKLTNQQKIELTELLATIL